MLSRERLKLRLLSLCMLLGLLLSSYTVDSAGASPGAELVWIQTSNPSTGRDVAEGVAVDSSGVYIVGIDRSLGSVGWRFEKRSLSDGGLIWSQTSNPSTGDDWVWGVAVDSSGIYVVGCDYSVGNYEWRIEKRSLTDGNLMWSQTSNPSTGEDIAFGVAVDSSGIYIVGCDSSPGNGEWRIEKRSLTNGTQPDGAKSQDLFSNALPFVAAGIVVIAITVVCIVIAIRRRKIPQPPSQPPSPDACSDPNPDTNQLSTNIMRSANRRALVCS